MAAASPPDRHGYFSLGTNADYVARLIGRVPFFLEATPHMPRTHGANIVHHSQVVGWCESDPPLVEVPRPAPSAVDEAIGELVAERIPDGATIQVGIGGVAAAVLDALGDHRDLGIHTELLHDGMVDLVEAGVVTGVQQGDAPQPHRHHLLPRHPALYDWLDDNPAVELLGVDFVNDPRVIARMTRFASVNATTEVDLLGQCASETVAGRYWSGSGGQADFARGRDVRRGGQGVHRHPVDDQRRPVPHRRHADARLGGHDAQEHRRPRRHRARRRRAPRRRPRRAGPRAHRHRRPVRRDDLAREAHELGLLR